MTLGVVVASNGYPLDYEKGIELPAKTEGDIITYYAGAKFRKCRALLSNGGVSICSSPQPIPSKKPKKPSTRNLTNKIQKASFTEQISEARP